MAYALPWSAVWNPPLPADTEYRVSFGDIEVLEVIGVGGQGQVFKGLWKNAEVGGSAVGCALPCCSISLTLYVAACRRQAGGSEDAEGPPGGRGSADGG